jgi:PAS domain S-box-containing protein
MRRSPLHRDPPLRLPPLGQLTGDQTLDEDSERARAYLAAIIECSDDAIIGKTLDGTIRSWNAAAERIFGYSASEAVGQSILLIIPPELHAQEQLILQTLRRGERISHFETTRLHKSGRRLDISLTVSPVRDAQGAIIGASKIARDITEQRRSAAQLAAIVESSDDAIISNSLSGIIQSWNAGAADMFGYRAEEALGQPITLIAPGELQAEEQRILEQLRRGERVEHYDTERVAKDGRRIPISLSISPIHGAGGELIGVSKIARNISERMEAESALRASEQRLWDEAYALERMSEWSTRLWRSETLSEGLHVILSANIELLSADRGNVQLLDDSGRELQIEAQHGFEPEFIEHFKAVTSDQRSVCGRALRSGERVIVEDIETDAELASDAEILRRAGCRAVVSTPLIASGGRLLGLVSAHFRSVHRPTAAELRRQDLFLRQACDFIQRCRMEQELRDSEEALREADRQKDEFLALLAHELRNPLAPICNAAEVLRRQLADFPAAQAGVDVIKRQSAQLTRLVDDLLDVARVTRGRIDLQRQTLKLDQVVSQALETVEPLLREKQHHIAVSSADGPLYVQGDFARLVQCVSNLLTNAVKYTHEGGDIRVQTRAQGQSACIAVSDNGAGIARELLPKIFDLFVQGQRTLDRAQGGLGIGLPVVKKLIEMHGGSVSASSAGIGRGSTFELCLPRTHAPMSAPAASPTSSVGGSRIFIVDDNPDGANSLSLLLQLEGHETEAVHSSREALERIEGFRPDFALLDIGLPGIDGYELLQRLQQLPTLAHTTFVAVTGYGQAGDRERIRRAGFQAHLVKPVNLPELLQLVSVRRPARA